MATEIEIEVLISGSVRNGGRYLLSKPATIAASLDAAGGLATAISQMRPSGNITVRRPGGPGGVDIRHFKITDPNEEWKIFESQGGELVVFQWDVQSLPA